MQLTTLTQFENALRWWEILLVRQFQLTGNARYQWMSQNLRPALLNRTDSQWVKQFFSLSEGELTHRDTLVRGATRYLAGTLARFVAESRAYRVTDSELLGVELMTVPFAVTKFPHSAFAIELSNPFCDLIGNPFSSVIVEVEYPDGQQFVRLTVFSDHLSRVGIMAPENLHANDLIRSIEISDGVMRMGPNELAGQLEFMFSRWPGIKKHASDFWMAWISVISHVASELARIPMAATFGVPPAVGPTLPSLPPLEPIVPETPFDVKEQSLIELTSGAILDNSANDSDERLSQHRQGREQRPTSRRGHYRRLPGQGHDPNGATTWVRGYVTKREQIGAGTIVGSRTVVGD